MKFGKFTVDVVETGIFALDGGAMFGVVPKALWTKAYHSGDELNRIPLSARPMLVRWDDKIILIDTGNGTKMSDKLALIYDIDRTKSSISLALKPFGLLPEDITDVILTHLHFDHAGGATKIENGKVIPTFKNAKHYVQKQHYEWALSPSDKDKASFFQENYLPLKTDGLLELLDGDGELFKGIELITVNGHTTAMQIVRISSEDSSLLYCADLCPTAAHINPAYIMGYDNSPMVSLEEKKRILSKAYEDGTILVYEHDAFTQASSIINTDKGFKASGKIEITSYGE